MRSDRPHNWRERRLGECGQWLSGGTPSKSHPEYWGGDIPWVGPKDLHARYVDDAEEHLTSLGASNGTQIVPKNTVLIVVRSMALARRLQISLTRRQVAFNQDIKAMRLHTDIDSRFFFYALWGRHDALHALVDEASHGTKRIRTDVLVDFPIAIPSVDEQKRIAAILASLDDKIDSNRRLAKLLEDTAAAIFRARFVDFVGVQKFDDSKIGRVPKGWTVAPVGDVLKVAGGATPSTKEPRYWKEGTHCWATPKDLAGNRSTILLDTDRRITDEGVRRISSKLLPIRTVLLSSRAPVGYTAVSFIPVAVNQGFIAIPPSNGLPSEFVLFWLRTHMGEIKAAAGGTTFAEISKRQFRPLPMVVPPPETLDEFARVVRPMFDLMAAQETEVRTLTQLRDAFLPKLISGEMRIPATTDPEEVIGPVADQLVGAAR